MQHMRGIHTSEHTRPASIPVNLQDARLKLSEALQLLGFCVLALIISIIGISIALAARPPAFETWNGFRVWFFLFGSVVAVVCLYLAWHVLRLMLESWRAYTDWCWMYVEVDIAFRQASGNQERTLDINAWELSTSNPRDVLLLVISLQAEYLAGNAQPHTVRTFTGDRWIGQGALDESRIRLGDVSSSRAEQFSKLLPQLGLVKGREARKAGEWVPESYDQAIALVAKNWRKVRL